MKVIEYGQQSRNDAVAALRDIAGIVGATLGPSGRPILLSKSNSAGQVTTFTSKDGYNVLKELEFKDPVHEAVHKLCLQASGSSAVTAGDGTTSTLVMAAAFAELLHGTADNNPQEAARRFKKEVEAACNAIQKEAIFDQKAADVVALTSTNGDTELSKFVSQALSQTSAYGTVIVEKNPMSPDRFKVDKEFGYQSGSGYNYNVTLGLSVSEVAANNQEFFLEDCYVLPFNGDLTQVSQFNTVIETLFQAKGEKFNLLIVAYEITDAVVQSAIYMNRKAPMIKVFLSKTTPSAEVKGPFQQLLDIAAFSGAQLVDGGSLGRLAASDLGKIGKLRVGPHRSYISGKAENNWIIKRAEQNAQAVAAAPSPFDKEIIQARNASLTGGCVKLVVGGGLFGDLHEIADRADDAIHAVQACLRSGALPGCGASYIRAAELAQVSPQVREALHSIHRKIMENYGYKPKDHFEAGQTICITSESISQTPFLDSGVADSYDTVRSVMANAFNLGSLVASLGGYCLQGDMEARASARLLKETVEGM